MRCLPGRRAARVNAPHIGRSARSPDTSNSSQPTAPRQAETHHRPADRPQPQTRRTDQGHGSGARVRGTRVRRTDQVHGPGARTTRARGTDHGPRDTGHPARDATRSAHIPNAAQCRSANRGQYAQQGSRKAASGRRQRHPCRCQVRLARRRRRSPVRTETTRHDTGPCSTTRTGNTNGQREPAMRTGNANRQCEQGTAEEGRHRAGNQRRRAPQEGTPRRGQSTGAGAARDGAAAKAQRGPTRRT
jgi:hypothetical protein